MSDLAYAQWTERGVQAVCPTTGEPYITSRPRMTTFGGHRACWCLCRHCDAEMHTRIDEAFDPAHPQQHLYLIDDTRHTGEK